MLMRPELSRRGALLVAGLASIALLAGCGEIHARQTLGATRPVTVALDAQPGALFAALYAAQVHGDFAAGALAVKIVAAPGGDSLTALESGSATIAIASEPDLLAARARGSRLVAIGALVAQPLDAIVSLANRHISNAGQLAGRTIATSGTPLAAAELDTALAAAHVAAAEVRRLAAPASLNAALTKRRAIATLGGPWPIETTQLELANHPARVLELPAAGVPSYSGLVIVVRVAQAHHDGPLLRAFLQSVGRGERALLADPQAAVAALTAANPQLRPRFEHAVLARGLPITGAADPSQPFGYQDPLRWRAFGVWMQAHGLLARTIDGALAITDEFLPGQGAG